MKTFGRISLGVGLIAIGVGIGLLILATFTKGSWKHTETYSYQQSYEGVKSLGIQIGYGNVKLVEGNGFSIDAQKIPKNFDLQSYVSDGVWYVKETGNNNFDLFGFDISIGNTDWHDNAPEITITVPQGFCAEDIRMNLSAGRLEADTISANTGSFNVDAGELRIDQLNVTKESEYKVGAGHMYLDEMTANNVIINCNVGSIEINGKLAGENEVSCNVGKVTMNLEGNSDQYSYDIDSDIGNVIIDGNSYYKKSIDSKSSGNTEGSFSLNCDIGNITLEFK